MCPPGLHITLGIFYRLFVLLEEAAHKLDLKYAAQQGLVGGDSYTRQLGLLSRQSQLKDEETVLSDEVSDLEQYLTLLSTSINDPSSNQQVLDVSENIREKRERRKQVVRDK